MVKWAWKLTMTLWTLRLKEWEYGDNMWAGLILGAVCHYAWGQQTSEVLPKTRPLLSGSWGRIVRLQWNGNGSLVSKSPPPVHSPTCTHFPRVKWVGTPQIPPRHRYKPAELRQRCRLWPVAAAGNVHSNGQWLTLLCFYSRLLFAMHLSILASETFLLLWVEAHWHKGSAQNINPNDESWYEGFPRTTSMSSKLRKKGQSEVNYIVSWIRHKRRSGSHTVTAHCHKSVIKRLLNLQHVFLHFHSHPLSFTQNNRLFSKKWKIKVVGKTYVMTSITRAYNSLRERKKKDEYNISGRSDWTTDR